MTTDSLHIAIHTWMQQVWNSFIIKDIFKRGAWAQIRAYSTPKSCSFDWCVHKCSVFNKLCPTEKVVCGTGHVCPGTVHKEGNYFFKSWMDQD